MDEGRLPWLALHLQLYDRPAQIRRVLKSFPSVHEVFEARRSDLEGLRLKTGIAESLTNGRALEEAQKELEKIWGKAYTLLTLEEPEYPEYLKEIFDPPLVLYCTGQTEAFENPAVAIVGSRKPTSYGRAQAERLADDLASRGCCVVSGLARGIDSCAHWGALRTGRTIAVLGSGLNVCYPRENMGLFHRIGEKGMVLSEFPLGTRPLSRNFPVRNRIITGLSLGLVVIEASGRSGSLISARIALEQGREVLAVPGNVTSDMSRGANGLLKSGAKLVEAWEDVAEELPSPWRERLLAQREEACGNERAGLDSEEERLLAELPADSLIHVDDLAEKTDCSMSLLLARLLGLELKGFVIQHAGKYFQRRI